MPQNKGLCFWWSRATTEHKHVIELTPHDNGQKTQKKKRGKKGAKRSTKNVFRFALYHLYQRHPFQHLAAGSIKHRFAATEG